MHCGVTYAETNGIKQKIVTNKQQTNDKNFFIKITSYTGGIVYCQSLIINQIPIHYADWT